MHDSLKNIRLSIKALKSQGVRPVELARSIKVHPLTYQELPYDPEYSNYAGRLTLEKLNNATPDEMYWKGRQEIFSDIQENIHFKSQDLMLLNFYKRYFLVIFQKLRREDVHINLLVTMTVELLLMDFC